MTSTDFPGERFPLDPGARWNMNRARTFRLRVGDGKITDISAKTGSKHPLVIFSGACTGDNLAALARSIYDHRSDLESAGLRDATFVVRERDTGWELKFRSRTPQGIRTAPSRHEGTFISNTETSVWRAAADTLIVAATHLWGVDVDETAPATAAHLATLVDPT